MEGWLGRKGDLNGSVGCVALLWSRDDSLRVHEAFRGGQLRSFSTGVIDLKKVSTRDRQRTALDSNPCRSGQEYLDS